MKSSSIQLCVSVSYIRSPELRIPDWMAAPRSQEPRPRHYQLMSSVLKVVFMVQDGCWCSHPHLSVPRRKKVRRTKGAKFPVELTPFRELSQKPHPMTPTYISLATPICKRGQKCRFLASSLTNYTTVSYQGRRGKWTLGRPQATFATASEVNSLCGLSSQEPGGERFYA